MTRADRAGGTFSRCLVTGSTAPVTCAARRLWGDKPMNGGRPVNISYASTPTADRSPRGSRVGAPPACLGAQDAGLHRALPIEGGAPVPGEAATALATP